MTNYIAALVDELYQLGVREVVISPGSRSTPLSVLFCEHQFKIFLNIDERSAGFFALGIAKEHQRPVVLVCTSGSAVAHYFPAVIEARYSRVPLIVLTADRPHELRHVGAPQAIDQNRIYGHYANFYEELALPEEKESMYRYVRVVMQKAYANAMSVGYGVSHINVPLREPLIPDLKNLDYTKGRSKELFQYNKEEGQISFRDKLFQNKKGIIICGGDAYADYHREVLELAERLQSPVLADPISNFRNYSNEIIIDSYDAFLKSDSIKKELAPEFILHFGQVPVSKRLQQFISMNREVLTIQVGQTFEYRNPALSTDQFVAALPKRFADSIQTRNSHTGYLRKWQLYQRRMRTYLKMAREELGWFEGKLIQIIQEMLPKASRLVAGNSMAIRDVDYFFEARDQNIKVFANRGANGIDGIVSTALGISTCSEPTVLLTGDLSFFHDFNGLLIGNTHHLNMVIVLFNNGGGGIFRYLPQSGEKYFDYLFLTPHGINFSGLTALFGVTYFNPQNEEDFIRYFNQALTMDGIKIIEVKIDLEVSKALHDHYTSLPEETEIQEGKKFGGFEPCG
ncbi:MAG: 2-succinyl-5-enolpyruvyl-6-hydroxy-3-cyclohexene-1-carboxylate synthase [Candidatus Dichloromethanomonas elyunquensis]|nr:MAG: 2-succinyl-5-enolpyruvyl-6-hydroxy-3-cyclohexene-1-carboxylate synthase [Candidatus Dichloromethanomonas elyunquensis]